MLKAWSGSAKAAQGILSALFVLVLSTLAATAQNYSVTPKGNDGNDCSSPQKACATFQRAVDLCPVGGHCGISVAPGTYSLKTNIFYYKVITISGPLDKNGDCADRGAVTIADRDDSKKDPLFYVQDHAILTISCMTLKGSAEGSVGFLSRQFAIGDINYIDFLQFPGGADIAASETSKINVASPGIRGDAGRFAYASDLSQIHIGGNIAIANGLKFDVAFLTSVYGSVVGFQPTSIIGGEAMTGASYQCQDAIVETTVTWLGTNAPYKDNQNCAVTGPLPNKERLVVDTLANIETQISGVQNSVNLTAAKIESAQEKIENVQASVGATASEIESVRAEQGRIEAMERHRQKLDHKRDIVMLIIVGALVLGNFGAIGWLRRRNTRP